MNKTKSRAIVIMYDGKEPSASVIETLYATIAQVKNSSKVVIKVYDEDSIADAIIGRAQEERAASVNAKSNAIVIKQVEMSELEQAVLFISKKFDDTKGDPLTLSYAIQKALCGAKGRVAFNPFSADEEDAALINAVNIISEEDNISPTLLNKYQLSKLFLSAVKIAAQNS